MKTYILLASLLPTLSLAQNLPTAPLPTAHQSVLPQDPQGETLKLIEIREFPNVYDATPWSDRPWIRTSVGRIYAYDGIDVENPATTLWPTMLALNDPALERLRWEFNDITERRRTAHTAGWIFTLAGTAALTVGALQAERYHEQLNNRQAVFQTVWETQPAYTTRTCTAWTGSTVNGVTNWRCSTDRTLTFTGATPPTSVQVQTGTQQVPVTRSVITQPNVTVSNGRGLMIGGLAAMLLGTIIYMSPRGDPNDTFHRAVQTYNRSLKRQISWEFQPFAPSTLAGIGLIGKF